LILALRNIVQVRHYLDIGGWATGFKIVLARIFLLLAIKILFLLVKIGRRGVLGAM
jgi:hypothetical protein